MTKQVFTVCARRWFDKVNGNSYYTLRVVCPDGTSEIVDITYGHGYATYLDAGRKAVERMYPNLNFEPHSHLTEPNGVKWVLDEVEVMRKKDLHNGGKW